MAIEQRRFELPGTTKLLAFHADKQDEGSSNFDPAFNFDGFSELLRSASSVRACARTNTLAERGYTRMRYALSVSYLGIGRRFSVATLVRCLGTSTTPAGHELFQFGQADAADANGRSGVVVRVPMPVKFGEPLKGRLPLEGLRFSVATPLDVMSGWTGSKSLREMWTFRAAIIELDQPISQTMHVNRIWDCIGPIIGLLAAATRRLRCIGSFPEQIIGTTRCRSLRRARCYILHEILARTASTFNILAGEHSTPPRSRRLLSSHSEKLRSTAHPESPMASRPNRTRGRSNRDDYFPFSNRLRQSQHSFGPRRAPLSASSTVGSPDASVAAVWGS